MSKKDQKVVCRSLGREVSKSATTKDLDTWLDNWTSRKKQHWRQPIVPAPGIGPGKVAPPPSRSSDSSEDPGFGEKEVEEKDAVLPDASKDLTAVGAAIGRRCRDRNSGKIPGKKSKAEAEDKDVELAFMEQLPSDAEEEPLASETGISGSKRKVFGWKSKGKAIKRLELVLDNLGNSGPKDQGMEKGKESRTFQKAHESGVNGELPDPSTQNSLPVGLPRELLGISPEEELRRGDSAHLPIWHPSQEKAPRGVGYGPELFWRQLRRLRPRPQEPYTDFAAQVTGLVGAWVEQAGAMTREEVIELIRLEHVVDQLPVQLCQLVLSQQPKTAMEAAILADQLSFQLGRHPALGPRFGPGFWPWFCQMQASPQKSTQKGHAFGKEVIPKRVSQTSGGGWEWKPTPVRTCHKCGKVGHTKANCTS